MNNNVQVTISRDSGYVSVVWNTDGVAEGFSRKKYGLAEFPEAIMHAAKLAGIDLSVRDAIDVAAPKAIEIGLRRDEIVEAEFAPVDGASALNFGVDPLVDQIALSDLAKLLGLSSRTIRRAASDGSLECWTCPLTHQGKEFRVTTLDAAAPLWGRRVEAARRRILSVREAAGGEA